MVSDSLIDKLQFLNKEVGMRCTATFALNDSAYSHLAEIKVFLEAILREANREAEQQRGYSAADWQCKKCGSVEWDVTDVDCRKCRSEAFDKWCESVKDCGFTVQPNSATARQRRLGWDAAIAVMGGVIGKTDEAKNASSDAPPTPSASGYCGEIRVVDEIAEEMALSDKAVMLGSEVVIRVDDAMAIVRPYLRHPEPVSVALNDAVRIMWNADHAEGKGLGDYDAFKAKYPNDCRAHGTDYWAAAKVCAEAWGLKWK